MITLDDINRSVAYLRDKGVSRVVLFGSAKDEPETANDLDLACNGLARHDYYLVVGELSALLRKPIDLVDLDEDTYIARHVEQFGRVIYERE